MNELTVEIPSPIAEGELSFSEFDECGWEFFTCKEPVKIKWTIWPDKNDPTNEIAWIDFDFGMTYRVSIIPEHNFLLHNYNGDQGLATYEERVRTTVLFDVMHAFTHYDQDPNYGHLHWAIRGWLDMNLEKHERTEQILAEMERVNPVK